MHLRMAGAYVIALPHLPILPTSPRPEVTCGGRVVPAPDEGGRRELLPSRHRMRPLVWKRIDVSNLATALVDMAQRQPQGLAMQDEKTVLTYADLDDLSARAAGGLRAHGVRPGGRVGLRLPCSLAFAVLYFGALRTGAVAVPVYPRTRTPTVDPCHEACGARLVFTAPDETTSREMRKSDTTLIPVGPDFLDQVTFWPRHTGVVHRWDHDPAIAVRAPDTPSGAQEALLSHRMLRTAALTARTLIDNTASHVDPAQVPPFSASGTTHGLNAVILIGACLLTPGGHAAVSDNGFLGDRKSVV